uniref:Uncharacterized protein n=1 Tax=Cucumis melo TaxID=3656 RepID=A0A9I9E967_CUCME
MPVQEEVDTGSSLKDAENASRASKTHIFDMDFDDLDNVPLDRLLKKSSILDVATAKCTYPIYQFILRKARLLKVCLFLLLAFIMLQM